MSNKYTNIILIENPIRCVLFKSEKKFKKELIRLGINNSTIFISKGFNAKTHLFSRGGESIAMICMEKGTSPPQRIALLVHEIIHVWQSIKKDIGEHTPSKEFEAYAIQGILHQLLILNPWVMR